MGTRGQKGFTIASKGHYMTWACKKNSNGTYHGPLNARGFKQIAAKHFNPTSATAPVTKNTTIRIVLVLTLLVDWIARINDVKGAFLNGKFEDSKEIFMEVPQSTEHNYQDLAALRLVEPIYGFKQAALLFWQRLLKMIKNMGHKRNVADPCIYFSRNNAGELAIWLN